jgi:hypothetical protein
MFTGGWFNREVRTKAQSWRPLGFIADTKVKSSAQNATSKFVSQDYQSVLMVILHEVAAVHAAGGFKHTLKLAGKSFLVTIKYPIAVIIVDAKRNIMLSAHYNSSKSKFIGQECDIPFTETDDPHFPCHRVTQQQVQDLYLDNDRKGVEDLCCHFVDNAFWNICFGANGHSIYQHCPPENLHSIKECVFLYLLKGFVQHLSRTRVALAELDSLFLKLSCKGCSHQSDREFPSISFPFGFSNISKVTGDKKEGVLIVIILLMETASGKASFVKAGLSGILLQ